MNDQRQRDAYKIATQGVTEPNAKPWRKKRAASVHRERDTPRGGKARPDRPALRGQVAPIIDVVLDWREFDPEPFDVGR